MSSEKRIVVFTGPSLLPREAARLRLPGAAFLPPVKRGDLAPLMASRPRAVAIIDGEFYQNLAVAPKEVLALLEAGITVYGASSMGALRAVELHRYGMIGVGSVFRLFRRGVLDADDEVALAYCRETYRPVSDPLVNTRFALRAAVRRGILFRQHAAQIIAKLKAAYFPERTRELLLLLAREAAGSERTDLLRQFMAAEAPDVKARDARLLLERIRRDLDAPRNRRSRTALEPGQARRARSMAREVSERRVHELGTGARAAQHEAAAAHVAAADELLGK